MSFATLLQITTGEPASPESNMHFNLADAMESHLSVLLIGIASPPPSVPIWRACQQRG